MLLLLSTSSRAPPGESFVDTMKHRARPGFGRGWRDPTHEEKHLLCERRFCVPASLSSRLSIGAVEAGCKLVEGCRSRKGYALLYETNVLCLGVGTSGFVSPPTGAVRPRFLRGTVRAGVPGEIGVGAVAGRDLDPFVPRGVPGPVRDLTAPDRVTVAGAKVHLGGPGPAARGPGPVRLLRVGDTAGNEHPHRSAAHLP